MLRGCPVRAFTPEVRRALRVFDATHDLVGEWVVHWEPRGFPERGGLAAQEAWLLEALREVRRLENQLLAEQLTRRRPATGRRRTR